MSAPRSFEDAAAVYFDGDSPVPQPVRLSLGADGTQLLIARDGRADVIWPAADVRQVEDHAGRADAVLRLTTDPLARLYVGNRDIGRAMPHLKRSAPPPGRGRLALWAAGAIAAVSVQIGALIPLMADQLAGYIPAAGERALGAATFEQIREALDVSGFGAVPVCEAPRGQAALQEMHAALARNIPEAPEMTVLVLDHPMLNAFALPGGYVVLFRGLIEAAEAPEEVAAVLAHEMGHVVSRDPTRNALRSAGSIGVLGLLFGDFAGGAAVLFLAERLINAQYSQSAEAEADAFARDLLVQASVPPGALADMFERLRERHGDSEGIVAHFESHPALQERIAALRAAGADIAKQEPILPVAAWLSLRSICL